jgi:hypothetical protein
VQTSAVAGRISKPSVGVNGKIGKGSDVQSRLDRLELLLERAVAGHGTGAMGLVRGSAEEEVKDLRESGGEETRSRTSQGPNMAADDGDGILLLNEEGSQFVSSLHFALLADEVSNSRHCDYDV